MKNAESETTPVPIVFGTLVAGCYPGLFGRSAEGAILGASVREVKLL